jgi:hypothetical protein
MATLAESAEVNLVSVFDAFPHPEQGAIGAGRNPLEREACGLGRIEQPLAATRFGLSATATPGRLLAGSGHTGEIH